jgi:prepilin-type N-terminal cleavage/methylation domain-containing protein
LVSIQKTISISQPAPLSPASASTFFIGVLVMKCSILGWSHLSIHRRRGLTLIELVVVLAILAGLAALLAPRLDYLSKQTEHATGAVTAADLSSVMQVHKASTGSYPALDLLTDGSAVYSKVWSVDGSSLPFTATTLSATGGERWYASFLDAGLNSGYVHVSSATDASNSTGTAAPIDLVDEAAAGTLTVAELNSAGIYNSAIVKACYPDTQVVPSGVKLIGLGIGPRNTMNGTTLASTPLETQGDDSKAVYCRYIAIFAIYSSGKPAQLKMVVDHRLKTIDKRLDQFKATGPNGV